MAFLRQLKLLLWKNGLGVVRQPLWSLTLIVWPLIIFIIIGVTRRQFPPVVKDMCFVGPRNLPSTGFFPFLQTLMCNADSNCHNKSGLLNKASSESARRSSKDARSNSLLTGMDSFNLPLSKDSLNDTATLIEALNNMFGSSYPRSSHNVSLMSTMDTSLPGDQESLNKMLESVNLLKRAICNVTLPMINTTQLTPFSYAMVAFCKSNNTVLEVSLNTLNQALMGLMLTKPDEMMTAAGAAMLLFDQLQNQTSLWENLLAIPRLFSSSSEDHVLASSDALLTNIQGAMNVIQTNFPEAGASLSRVHPFLAGGINLIHYIQNWPGKDVPISLGAVVTLQNDSLSEMVKRVLQDVQIPLDKAIGLTLDRGMVRSYLCDNSSNPLWLTAACSTGTLDMLLRWISPDKMAKQALLAWSQNVAPHDVSFAKGLLHSLMGGSSPGGQGGPNTRRTRRSIDTQPQNIDEELFLRVGQVAMDLIQIVPQLDLVVQSILRTAFQAMNSATLAVDTVEEILAKVLNDADQLQMTYLTLLTNQSEANVWIGRVLDSVMEIIPKILSPESLTCEDVLGPFEWLLNTESIEIELWRSMICQNSSALQNTLLMDWMPLGQKVQDVYKAFTGQRDYNVTLPMILSQWHQLCNNTMQFGVLLDRVTTQLSGEYWMNWMQENSTHDVTVTLEQSVSLFMVNLGEMIEKSQLWPEVKNYFHMLYWILNYRPGVTTQPANCSIDMEYSAIQCDTGLKWPQFVQATIQALMSPNQDVLVNCLKGSVDLLQHVYGDIFKDLAGSYLKQEIKGGDALSVYLMNLMQNLDSFVKTIFMLPDRNVTNPDVMLPLIGNLLKSTGLGPLLPLLFNGGPLNFSAVLDVASRVGRLNQHIFTFNETDPTMPQLEQLIRQFLSLEGNLTMSLSHIMGHTLLTYSDYFNPDDAARFLEGIRPFTNQTSSGIVEAILSAMELLKTVVDSPNGDPTNIILGYLRQLQEFVKSLYRLRKIQQLPLPNGQLSTEQVTDLSLLSKDFLDLLTQESLQNLSQAGPDAAQNIVAQKLVAFLPLEVQQEAARFLQDFKALQDHVNKCAAGQNCLAGVSEIFRFLDQILDLMLSANGNVTIKLAGTNSVLEGREHEEITSLFFSLLLSSNDAANVETFKQTLHFIRLVMTTPNVTVSDVQNSLRQSNLTLEELNHIASLAGAANINDLVRNMMQIINVRQCFEAQQDPIVMAQCVMGLINGVSSFLTHLPALRNETAILSLVPLIVNNTISDVVQANFSSNPNMALTQTMNNTLTNIKRNLQLNNLYTPEIMNEFRVVEGLIQLVANTEPFDNVNTTLLMNPMYAQKVYLEIVEWYLKRLENITSTSSFSELLQPLFSLTQMQVTLQLAYTDLSSFFSQQIEMLINSLQYPIDGAGVRKVGLTTVEILRSLLETIMFQLETQNKMSGYDQLFNTTILNVTELQVKLYLDLIQKWMTQPNVTSVLSSMLQLGNPNMNTFKQLVGSYLKQEIKGGDALSDYLINLMQNLDGFVNTISMLPGQNVTNPDVILPLVSNLLQSAGLGPLLPLLFNGGPLNVSAVLDVASRVGRLNQHIFTFNETDPTMPQLEQLIRQFLSLEGNLTMSLSHIMGHTLLTYSDYFNPDDAARFLEAIRPFTNQTSSGIVEAILSAMELLKTVVDSPNGDPTNIILGYLRQLQEFVKSLYRLRKIQQLPLPNGQLSTEQVTDLSLLSKDFLDLLTQESLQNLSQAGPDAAQNIVAQKLVAFLPLEVQQEAARFLQDFKALQDHMNKCAAGQNCLAGVSEIFRFLDQILDLMLSANVNVTIKLAGTNSVLEGREYEEISSLFFSLLLSSNDAANVETFKQTLHFIRLIMTTPNVTVSDVQNSLRQSNLTLEELNHIASLAGAANINDLVGNMMQIINVRQCFEAQQDPIVMAQCVMGLINGVSSFLTHLPALRNETAILSLVPLIVNNSISDVIQANFSSNPNMALAQTMNNTLANIKRNLQLNNLYTLEIMNEFRVVEGLIQLVANTEPFDNVNTTLLMNPMYAQNVYLEIVEWYLKRLENITSTSSFSELLQPLFSLTQMQVTLQLAYTDLSSFLSQQIEMLVNSLQYPIDGAGVRKVGLTTVEILRSLLETIMFQLETQNKMSGYDQLFNTTILNVTELQVKLYLDLIQKWMTQPNVTSVLSSMLQLGNPNMNTFKQLVGSYLKQEIKGGDALSDYLINLMQNLDGFVNTISMLPGQNVTNPDVILPLVSNLLQSAGLGPLLPLLFNGGPLNVSAVLDVASRVGRLNQHIFTFNETDPTMPQLEQLIRQFLSLEGNLTMSLSHIMGHTLLTYSDYFNPDDAARFLEAIRPFTNQTSSGIVEAILSAMELLKMVVDSPNGDPTNIILGYLRQLQEFVKSLYRLRKIQQLPLPNGQLSTEQVTDLSLLSKDFLDLLTQESLQNLSQAGPDAAQNIVAQKLVAFLPLEVQQEAARFLQDFKALQDHMNKCAAGQNCLAGVSEIFRFLDQILDLMLSANVNVTIKLAGTNSVLEGREYEEISSLFFSLLLSSNDAANVETFKQTLHFIRLIMTTPNVTVSDVQNSLRQSNLTLEELNHIASLAGAANINDLVGNMMQIINVRQCFEAQQDPIVMAQCVMGLINGVSSFLTHLPALRNETAILSLVPLIVNNSISDVIQANFSSNPNMALAQTMNNTLANIKRNLQLNNLYTPEIMNEFRVVEGLIQLVANTEPFDNVNTTLLMNPMYAQKVYLEIVEWYLKRLENITSTSSFSELLQPLFSLTQMQVTLQLAYTDLSSFLSQQIEMLVNSLQYPIDGAGVRKVGLTTVEILRSLLETIMFQLETQNKMSGYDQLFNTSILNVTELQVKLYLNLIQKWMTQPNVPLVLSSMLQWGNPNINVSTPARNLQHLLGTIVNVLSEDQQAYLSSISNITMSLSKALMVAEQPGGLQSDHFFAAFLEAVQRAMQLLTTDTGPLTLSVQQNILDILQDSLKLIFQPNISFASSRNISLLILKRTESVIQQTVPEMFAEYLISGIKAATTYFESISTARGPDSLNQLILDEMKMVYSILPANSTAQAYVAVLINITHIILESGRGNMSLWASFESASVEHLPMIFGQMGKLLSKIWPLVMGGPGPHTTTPSLEGFAHLVPVLEKLMSGKADQHTWDKLEMILQALLSTLNGTELSVIPQFEKIIGNAVINIQAQNVLITSLQMPVVTLIREIAQSVNTSHLNLSEVSERVQLSIERTVQLAEQANGSLKCSEVLKAWEPVRKSAWLSNTTMAMWCNVSVQPVFEAYAAAQTLYTHMNMSHMGVGQMTVSAASARTVKALKSFYQVNINSSFVMEKLIEALLTQFSKLAARPLSHEAELHWRKQFYDMQLQTSLSSFKMVSVELVGVAPSVQPYIEAIEKALNHLIQDGNPSQDLLREAAMIFLSSANIPMMWGNVSETSLNHMMREAVKVVIDMKIFGNVPMVYQALEQFLANNSSSMIVQKVAAMSAWLASTQASGLDLLTQALPKIFHILRPLLSVLTQMSMDMPANMEQFEDLAGNTIAMLSQFVSTSGLLNPMDYRPGIFQPDMTAGNHMTRVRHRREAPMMLAREPMDDFMDLLNIEYHSMFKAISVPATATEIMETVNMFLANPNLSVVVKGATSNMPWDFNAPREQTIDAALEALSFFTLPGAFQMPSMDLLTNAADMLPAGFPFSSVLKNIARALASESQENLMLMQEAIQIVGELLQINLTDPRFKEQLGHLESKVCTLEETESLRQLLSALSIEPGQLCQTLLPSLQVLVENLMTNMTSLTDAIFQTIIGDPETYNVQSNWSSVLSRGLGFNTSNLSSFNINVTSPGPVTVGEMLRNKTAFIMDVQQHMNFDPAALHLLMGTTVPNNNLEILSWLLNLRHCNSNAAMKMIETDVAMKTFCSMSVEQWYSFSLLIARHLNMEKVIYRMVLSEELQSMVGVLLHMAEVITNVMNMILPAVDQLQTYMHSVQDLNLMANSEFHQMVRGQRSTIRSKATFVTLSRVLCNKGILALLGISKLPVMSESNSSFTDQHQREEMIERFKIPPNSSPFCMNMYLDMVNTTGGAIAWAFLKPMLMGHILYSPDTPVTRAIMEKANGTLQEFANLRKYSEDWIGSANYIIKSTEILSHTLPMLQNSLGNSFVENFIQMQTDINVGSMKETLSNFSNMTIMLEKNKHIMDQITTLSNLMVNISSCIKFDRYRGYDSADELNTVAQDLAKNRDLYASVIFKLSKDDGKRQARSSPSASSLPPKVSYTIRMHMDNVMRTDRVRDPYFYKDSHISARQTLRYNRGFVYLQENIDRAIIETQTGLRITETAVQLQPFPYPCHLRDEYLEAISFVFPLMLMIAWVLFVADFVKKLVHERELRLHEYMKMMGVNPLSHFFAWFVECATYLILTVFFLTLLLKYGKILPHSDGFLLFLYLCDYALSILSFSYLVSSFFDKTYIAGLSGSLLYILCFFPFIVVVAVETKLTFFQKSALGLFSPTCFSYASQYVSRYESQGEGIQWSNSYTSPVAGDTASFGWLCWLMLIDSIIYFLLGVYVRMVFPGKYGIAVPWYFPFKASFWGDLCCCIKTNSVGRGLLFTNIMQKNQPVFSNDKGKGQSTLSSQAGEDFSELPVGVALHGLSKIYGDRVAIENLNISFYEGHVTSLLGHNGAGKTTTMSLLTGLFAPSSGSIEVYGKDMQSNIEDVRRELGVCMQYDVLFDHMTTNEHLLLYGQIKAPHWSNRELHEQIRTILEEMGMYAHRHKRVGTLSGGMKRKLSISIAFIGGSRLVVLDEPTTGVDPCSRRNIWDIVIQHKKHRTIIMSTHHLDEAEVLSDRIAFLERGGLKCCGSPFHLKDKLGQGYKVTLSKKMRDVESERIDNAELKAFIQAHVPEARLKEAQGGDMVYSLPPFTSSNASSYRSLLTALDSNLDALQLGGYGISDTTLEEVFLHLTDEHTDGRTEDSLLSVSETVSDTDSINSFHSDSSGSISGFGDTIKLTGSSTVRGMALAWQQMKAILIKRFHHSRRDWKGLISQILLPILFMVCAMGLGSIKNDLQHYPKLELSPALYNYEPSYSFFSNQNPNSAPLMDTMITFPGIDNACLDKSDNPVCTRSTGNWHSSGNHSKAFSVCKCTRDEQICPRGNFQPPHKKIPSSQIVYNLSGINLDNYLVATANDFIRNRYGGFAFGMPLPPDLQMDLRAVPKNRTLAKVWFNPEGHHSMPAYLNSLSNLILRSNLPANKDPRKYAISVSSHPYFGRADDEDSVVQGMLQILVAMCVLTGYSITTASFAIYEVTEHHSGSKRLQHISGISEPFYWAVNFFYDMAMYMIPVTLTVAVVAIFQIPAFTDRQNLGAVTLLLVLFGFATFPWMYLLSGVFKDAEMAFIAYVCINLFISINTIMSTSILFFLGQISLNNPEFIQEIFKKLSHAFLIFPQFNFGNGLMKLARMNIEVQLLSGYGLDVYKNPFSTDALGWMFIASFLQGVVFFTLRLLLNRFLIRKVRNLIWRRKTAPEVAFEDEDEDEDVATEKLRVSSGAASTDVLQVNQLSKVYQHLKKKVHAVKRLSVGIPAGECFGLLGENGAGKTTTFKMLTGDISSTDGTAQIRDCDGRLVDIMECRNRGINIGYCPQVDALDDLLTGEEHLYFYAGIRGIAKGEIDRVVNYLLKRLELSYHRNIITDGYSCGTRRKLSTALALIGHPQILLLDEPSSGMDPRTKRHLWKIISEEVKGKCAVVLTSHSMEECEALCGRLAIMVKGQFRCLGSLQHIKNRFGSGFTVKMYLSEATCDAEEITGFMQQRFPSTYLKDQHSTMVEYHVPVAPGGVADIFDQLESNKNALHIKHFSVSQTTLDEVFINFATGKIIMESISLDSQDQARDLDCIKAVET